MSTRNVPAFGAAATALAALLFALPALALCPPISFEARVSYPVPNSAVAVVSADFTGDGIPDLAVTQSGTTGVVTGSIAVLPGRAIGGVPDGTFDPRIETPLAGTPYSLATADIDADGRPDLIVSNWGANIVQVLIGTGGGRFAQPVSFAAGTRPYELVVADFNADGVLDIAVANNGENAVRVLIGDSDGAGLWNGGFAPSVAYPTSDLSLSIVAGDFDNDGILDLVATEYLSGTVAVFLGQGSAGVGDGTFGAPVHVPAGGEPYDLATGDFNEDGWLDLAVNNSGPGGVHVLLGSGSGNFPVDRYFLAGVNCSGVSPADVDGDGITDLVVSASVGSALHLLRGRGTGGVGDGDFDAPVTLADSYFSVHVITTDLDQNGRPDAVTCGYLSGTVDVFLDGCSPNPNLPRITRIRDVPNDQGGKVFVTWTASGLDVPGGPVNGYLVWRQVPPEVAAASAVPATQGSAGLLRSEVVRRPDGTSDIIYWEALATLPAQRLEGYGYTAATPQDSLPGGNPLFTFRITAITANIDLFYDSDPDSGYSVDNLSPSAPVAFLAQRSGGVAELSWEPSPDVDFASFLLYRSSDPDFTPSPATLLATLATPGYSDPQGGAASYKLGSTDVHGNTSAFVSAPAPATTDVQDGTGRTWLAAPSPNPTRGDLEVRCALARPSHVSLALFDQQGRVVRTLLDGPRPAGELSLRWDARNDAGHAAAPGFYLMELRAGGLRLVRRVILIR